MLQDCLQSGSKDKLLKRKPSSQIEKTNGPVELLSTVEADGEVRTTWIVLF